MISVDIRCQIERVKKRVYGCVFFIDPAIGRDVKNCRIALAAQKKQGDTRRSKEQSFVALYGHSISTIREVPRCPDACASEDSPIHTNFPSV